MLYNILWGGYTEANKNDRLPLIASAVRGQSPDILAVLEADHWDKNERPRLLADATGLAWYVIGVSTATRHHLGLFAHTPLQTVTNHPDHMNTTILKAQVPWKGGGEFQLLVVHLHPRNEEARLPEVDLLLDHVRGSERVLVLGDFNSLSPEDPYDREDLLASLRGSANAKFGVEQLRFKVITRMLNAGLVDLQVRLHGNRQLAFTVPTPSNIDQFHSALLRLDYAFATPALAAQCVSIEVIHNQDTERASDHYPLFLTLSA